MYVITVIMMITASQMMTLMLLLRYIIDDYMMMNMRMYVFNAMGHLLNGMCLSGYF